MRVILCVYMLMGECVCVCICACTWHPFVCLCVCMCVCVCVRARHYVLGHCIAQRLCGWRLHITQHTQTYTHTDRLYNPERACEIFIIAQGHVITNNTHT